MSATYTVEEVAKHSTPEDAWLIIDGAVYNITKFIKYHPGGVGVLLEVAGQDVTDEFLSLHKAHILTKYARFKVGTVTGAKVGAVLGDQLVPGFISQVPYAENSHLQGFKSPYFTESHRNFRVAVRKVFDADVRKEAEMFNRTDKPPSDDIYLKLGEAGVLAAMFGPGPWLQLLPPNVQLPGGLKPKDMDYFHEQIVHEEKNRLGYPGYQDGIGVGMVIGLPPVVHFSSNEVLKNEVITEVLMGRKKICLAISEPYAGSDVANIRCTAKKTPDGKHYIVNGIKKWITNGYFSDYFTTAVRTGGPGIKGISVLLIPRSEGVTTKKMKTSYSGSAGTSLITFRNVKVPVENLLGKEGRGFKIIVSNFNHERWFIIAGVCRATRLIVEESFKWAMQRRVFGKPLITQPVIRNKLAHMVAQVESVQHWLDNITFQMNTLDYKQQTMMLAGPLALLKLHCTRVALRVSDECCQVFGGRAITRTGMGAVIERNQRAIKYGAILGGSEEIMADLGIKMSMKSFPTVASKL